MAQTPDDELGLWMQRFQAGDETAFARLHEACVRPLTGYLARLVSPGAADDLAQETFLRMIEARRTFRPGAPFRPWLYGIARHVALDARRRGARRREVAVAEPPDRPVAPHGEEHLDGLRLAELVGTLPPDQREVVWLARVEGLTSPEIAAVVGASPGAVKVRLHRATARLRALFAADPPGGGLRGGDL